MKFTRRLAANSLELLNLRVVVRAEGCRHCGCRDSVIAHGHLHGIALSGLGTDTRGLRFFVPIATRTQVAAEPFPSNGMM